MKEDGFITFEFDPHNPPPLTQEQRDRLAALAAMPDSEIDYSDIPPLDEAFWQNAKPNPFFHGNGRFIVNIEKDVLAWLDAMGGDRQAKLNAILREAMLRDAPKV